LTIFLLAILVLLVTFRFGSISDAVEWSRGNRFYFSSSDLFLGDVESGKALSPSVRLINHYQQEFHIIGSSTSCKCSTIDALPLLIPKSSSYLLKIKYVPQSDVTLPVNIRLFTDNPEVPELRLRIFANVHAP
jgi:hypothetical protein